MSDVEKDEDSLDGLDTDEESAPTSEEEDEDVTENKLMARAKPQTVNKGATKDELLELFDLDTDAGPSTDCTAQEVQEEVAVPKAAATPPRRRVRTRGGVVDHTL